MIRTYKLKQLANNEKLLRIISVINEYRKTALTISKFQWKNFFLNKKFDKNLDIKHLQSNLSERYKQTNQYQVVGIL